MPGSVIPPPLVRGGQQTSSKLGPQASSQVVMPPLVRGAQVSRAWAYGAIPSNYPSRKNGPSSQNGALSPSVILLSSHCLVSAPHPDSKSTTSDNIPAQGRRHSSWLPGHLCPVCRFRDRGSFSRASSVSPTSPTLVCSSTSHR